MNAFLPWTDGSGRPWRGWRRLPLMTPFVLLYLVLSWALFLPLAERAGETWKIDQEALHDFLFYIPDLSRDIPGLLLSLVTAPVLNHDSTQIVYVTALLLAFGVIFEAREGTARAAGIFLGTTIAAALLAGVALHLVYPDAIDHSLLQRAWGRTWSGGSAGAFGLMGALAARARRPWPLAATFVLWEIAVAVGYLRSYTSTFHLTAFALGFLVTRFIIPPAPGHRVAVSRSQATPGC